MKLFKVTTKRYKDFYVIADDYNAAVAKVERYIESVEVKPVIDSYGALNIPCEDEDDIREIKLLTDTLIR